MNKLSIQSLCKEAAAFSAAQSKTSEKDLFGVTDGKAVGTFLEHKFRNHLKSRYEFNDGNSASGIDFPWLISGYESDQRPPAPIILPIQICAAEGVRIGLFAFGICL